MATVKAILEHALSAGIAILSLMVFLMMFVAEPLDFRAILADADVYRPGDEVTVRSVSRKPAWSARLCTATGGGTYLRDATGQEFSWASAVDFNDGTKPGLTTRLTIPRSAATGAACVLRRVVYRCMGVFSITVSSTHAPLCITILPP